MIQSQQLPRGDRRVFQVMEVFACGLCESMNFSIIFTQKDRYEQQVSLAVCNRCGLRQLNPRKDDDELKDFYTSQFYSMYGMDEKKQNKPKWIQRKVSIAKGLLDSAEAHRSLEGSRLLDIGCGHGFLIKLAEQRGCLVSGIEASEKQAQELKAAGFNVFAGTFQQYFAENRDLFEIITLSHVLEHVAMPREFLKDIRQLLKPDGLLVIEVPNIGWQSVHGKYPGSTHSAHIYYFTEKTLQALLEVAGLEVLSTSYGKRGAYLRAVATSGVIRPLDELNLPIESAKKVMDDTSNALIYRKLSLWKRFINKFFRKS